ncbi:MAG: helix-turn-helix domain-containing protein [Alphaproteobacteria bacterium]
MKKRNRIKTEENLLRAAADLLRREGFSEFGVNAVAREAGVDKVLIYRYFDDLDGLLSALADHLDLWPSVEELISESDAIYRARPAAQQIRIVFRNLLKGLRKRPLTLEIMAWELAERNPLTRKLEIVRADLARIFTRRYGHTGPAEVDLSAFVVILSASIHYLTARMRVTDDFNGMTIGDDQAWQRLETSLDMICDRMLA